MPRTRRNTKRGSRPQLAPETPEKNLGGRPSKYCPEIVKRICKNVKEGCSRDASAALSGINVDTLYQWQQRYPEFSDALQKADSQCQQACIRAIRKAGRSVKNWTANAWLLERKFPQVFGRIDRHLLHMQGGAAPLPEKFVEAINRALGIGRFIPLESAIPLLAESANGNDGIDRDVLPQD